MFLLDFDGIRLATMHCDVWVCIPQHHQHIFLNASGYVHFETTKSVQEVAMSDWMQLTRFCCMTLISFLYPLPLILIFQCAGCIAPSLMTQRQLCARSLLSCWLIAINKNSKQPSRNRQRTHGSGDLAIVQRRIPLRSYDFDEWCAFCDLCGSKTLSNDAWNILRKHSRNDLLDAIWQHQCAVLAGDSLIQKSLCLNFRKCGGLQRNCWQRIRVTWAFGTTHQAPALQCTLALSLVDLGMVMPVSCSIS